jgi:hypothetical protein
MPYSNHRVMTFKGVNTRHTPLQEVLSSFSIRGFVSDDEFAADIQLLVNGEMSPEEHREYLKNKYSCEAA